jgi:hypothetical protein
MMLYELVETVQSGIDKSSFFFSQQEEDTGRNRRHTNIAFLSLDNQ